MALKPDEARELAMFRKAALASAKGALKLSRLSVYRCLVDCIHYPDMTARKSIERIAEETGLCDKTVKTSLATLRKTGWIKAVAYANGGRGKSPVYAFLKGGENVPGLGGASSAKGGKNSPEKGGKNIPPYNSSSEYNAGAPSRRDVDKVPDDQRHTENRLLSQWTRLHGYGQARLMIEEWRKEQDAAAS
ncbi:helix-turn-helix domain-containing protein [Tritonibacter mobilis]|uniref:hypothetical protein n=1 Tax=Tritonibacter mobilis TaxID=379347 RepID=UPI000806B45F|nr:hypothetical protein [Tritonibacter mobilis]